MNDSTVGLTAASEQLERDIANLFEKAAADNTMIDRIVSCEFANDGALIVRLNLTDGREMVYEFCESFPVAIRDLAKPPTQYASIIGFDEAAR